MTDRELLEVIADKVASIDKQLTGVDNRLTGVEKRLTSVELTLENETNPNIKEIAAGRLDLSRKFDDALKVENEKEMLSIRVTILENELRKVKESIAQLA